MSTKTLQAIATDLSRHLLRASCDGRYFHSLNSFSVDRPITAKLRFCDDGAIFPLRYVHTFKAQPAYISLITWRFGVYGLYTHAPSGLAHIGN